MNPAFDPWSLKKAADRAERRAPAIPIADTKQQDRIDKLTCAALSGIMAGPVGQRGPSQIAVLAADVAYATWAELRDRARS